MCGFLAFAGYQPDLDLLGLLTVEAGRRGPDGSGWAIHTRAGWTLATDYASALPGHPPPAGIEHATLVVAHARLATDGGVDPTGRVQPYPAGGGMVAYNGCLPGVWPHGDTAVLADLVTERGPRHGLDGFLARAAALDAERQALVAVDPVAGLWAAQRAGHYGVMPLHVAHRPEGVYLCSRPFPSSTPLAVTQATCLYHGRDHPSIP